LIAFQALNTKTLRPRHAAKTSRLFNELKTLWENTDKDLNELVLGITDNVNRAFASACKAAGSKQGGFDRYLCFVL
jgi:hypothetical protein